MVLGVVLALAANEWRGGAKRDRHAALAADGVRQEIQADRDAVAEALRYHHALSDTLSVLAGARSAEGEPVPEARLFPRGYIAPATVLRTAWEAANATDAVSDMPYDDVLVLSDVYAEQQDYELQTQRGAGLIYARLFDEGHGGMLRNFVNLNTLITTFWYRECRLLDSYDRALVHLGSAAGSANEKPPMCSALSS